MLEALTQLVYMSQSTGAPERALLKVLDRARNNNQGDDITSAIVIRDHCFLQLLEGHIERTRDCYHRIAKDARHARVTLLSNERVTQRLFPRDPLVVIPIPADLLLAWRGIHCTLANGGAVGRTFDARNLFIALARVRGAAS